jgi:hypothetical protein
MFAIGHRDKFSSFNVKYQSTRATTQVTGTMHIKVGFIHLPNGPNSTIQSDFMEAYKLKLYNALIKRFSPEPRAHSTLCILD